MHTNKTTFQAEASCSECGHSGNIFISDETIAKGMADAVRERSLRIYLNFMAPRFVALCLIVFLFGLTIGFKLGDLLLRAWR